MALVNIEQRLQGLFGDDAGLQIQNDPGFFRIQLQYPLGFEP